MLHGWMDVGASFQFVVDKMSDDRLVIAPDWRGFGLTGIHERVRMLGGDALFTAETQEPNWHKAHNILLPTFAHRMMQTYHEGMLDIAEQLVTKWERLNADEEIDAKLKQLFPADLRVAQWNRKYVHMGMTTAGREFIKEALTAMGCADRAEEIKSVPDLIEFDEGRIE